MKVLNLTYNHVVNEMACAEDATMCYIYVVQVQTQLPLKQHGFELHGPIYTSIVFQKNISKMSGKLQQFEKKTILRIFLTFFL